MTLGLMCKSLLTWHEAGLHQESDRSKFLVAYSKCKKT
jgi:hypothetical protein